MKNLSIALIYLGFFGLLGFACWFTESAMPLWGLLLTPEISTSNE